MLIGSDSRQPLLTIATVCWNHSFLLEGFLRSFMRTTPPASLRDVQMVIVDNGSSDDTPRILDAWRSEASHPPWKTVVRSPTNLGYAGGANLAFREANGRYLLLLNNDVEFTGDIVKACVRAYADEPRAILGTKLIHRAGPWNQLHGKVIRYLEGWCLLAGLDLFREIAPRGEGGPAGVFDETFSPAFFEDMDLSLRAHLAGVELRTIRLPVRHLESRTTKATPSFQFMDVIHENQRRFQEKWRDLSADVL